VNNATVSEVLNRIAIADNRKGQTEEGVKMASTTSQAWEGRLEHWCIQGQHIIEDETWLWGRSLDGKKVMVGIRTCHVTEELGSAICLEHVNDLVNQLGMEAGLDVAIQLLGLDRSNFMR